MVSEGFQSGLKPRGFRVVQSGLKPRGFREFQSGLKPCGFRGVSEWSETVWFQSGFRVV